MATTNLDPATRRWTAADLRGLPAAERDTILAASADLADAEYRTDPDLTDFDAFGKDDFHGDSASAGPR